MAKNKANNAAKKALQEEMVAETVAAPVEEVAVEQEEVVEEVKETVEEAATAEEAVEPVDEETKVVEEPVAPVVEEPVKKSEPVADKVVLNRQQRAFIFKLISNGHTVKDVLANIRYKLRVSDEVFDKLSKNVRTTNDLLRNLGIDV